PSPLMGEGKGEGVTPQDSPLPLTPSHEGRGEKKAFFKRRGNLLFGAVFLLFVLPCAHAESNSPVYRTASGFAFRVEGVAQKLELPSALAFAPDGRIFVTERPGRLRVIENGQLQPEPAATIPDVLHFGEGGLMAIALDPGFATNHLLYLSYTARSGGGTI